MTKAKRSKLTFDAVEEFAASLCSHLAAPLVVITPLARADHLVFFAVNYARSDGFWTEIVMPDDGRCPHCDRQELVEILDARGVKTIVFEDFLDCAKKCLDLWPCDETRELWSREFVSRAERVPLSRAN